VLATFAHPSGNIALRPRFRGRGEPLEVADRAVDRRGERLGDVESASSAPLSRVTIRQGAVD
jgi:hypothetical protein